MDNTSRIKTPLTPYFPGDLFFGQFDSQPRLMIFPLRINWHNPINRVHWNGKADARRSSRRALLSILRSF